MFMYLDIFIKAITSIDIFKTFLYFIINKAQFIEKF